MNQSNKALRDEVGDTISRITGGFQMADQEIDEITALVTNHIKGALPDRKWPATIDDIPKFTEPLIAETINSKSTIDPWINKGYNQALDEVHQLLEEVSNGK